MRPQRGLSFLRVRYTGCTGGAAAATGAGLTGIGRARPLTVDGPTLARPETRVDSGVTLARPLQRCAGSSGSSPGPGVVVIAPGYVLNLNTLG
jgi:hypothetical protein